MTLYPLLQIFRDGITVPQVNANFLETGEQPTTICKVMVDTKRYSWRHNNFIMNTKSLYCNILKCNYMSSEITAVKKLRKVPMIGSLSEERVCNAMKRIILGVNTATTLRAAIEFALGGFRSYIEISIFSKEKQAACFCFNIIEKYNKENEKGRDPIFHLLFDGAPARFLRSHLRINARRTLGQAFDININSISFNEIPLEIVEKCDTHALRRGVRSYAQCGCNVLAKF